MSMAVLLGILVLIVMIVIGVSIPFAFGATLVYFFAIMGGSSATTISVGFSQLNSLVLLAIPMFVIAGGVIEKGKLGDALINFIDMFIGHIKGGLGAVSVITSAIFGAITGSCAACLSCIGSIMIPKLRKAGYDDGFATALLVNAGPLGLLIPPSADQILYAWSANVSVLACFLSTVIPGIILAIVAFLALNAWSTYNSFVTIDQDVEAQWGKVQVQYQRRMDLIPNLVRTVQGYAAHESETYENVTRARAGLDAAMNAAGADSASAVPASETDFQRYNSAQDGLNRALSIYVNAVREAYPDLKADTQFLSLQDQLEGTENRIATERGRYTEIVRDYNVRVRKFPANIWAGLFGYHAKPQFAADEAAATAPTVQF